MKRAMNFPGKYIQGEHAIAQVGDFLKGTAKKAMVIWGRRARESAQALIPSLESNQIVWIEELFVGECTKKKARQFAKRATQEHCDVVIGLGGGKAMDLAKGVAVYSGARCVIVPTVAASDAATSAHTCWYTDDSVLDGLSYWSKGPDLVVADTDILIGTPLRMFVAGLGDALATYIEGRASYKTYAMTAADGRPTMASLALCKLSFDIIMEYGREAVACIKEGLCTPIFEKVIEATILLSGLGWESCGTATAHMLGVRLSRLPETHKMMHGEDVAFGIVTQLMLDHDQDLAEAKQVVDFMVDVGLPVTLEEIGLGAKTQEELLAFSEELMKDCVSGGVHNHNFPTTAQDLFYAMRAADAFGRRRKSLKGFKNK